LPHTAADRRFSSNSEVKPYARPKESAEGHPLDNIQIMFKSHFGDTVLAPIPHDAHKILDCGAGSGNFSLQGPI
jgi:hypothetical protein